MISLAMYLYNLSQVFKKLLGNFMVDLSGIYYLYRFLGQGGTFEWS
jgi:hypothetical protein